VLACAVAALLLPLGITTPAEASSATTIVNPGLDRTSLIRNPGMGWGLYIEEFENPIPDPVAYWTRMNESAAKASHLYIRVPWAAVEPTQGNFFWETDTALRRHVQEATRRGLKVAFRITYHSGNSWRQATPQWVFDAGAVGYQGANSDSDFLSPRPQNAVFQAKYGAMVAALGKQYNDPSITSFVDGTGLGLWGENHSEDFLTEAERDQVYRWATTIYSTAFNKVLVGLQYGENTYGYTRQNEAIRDRGYMIRRDSLGCAQWLDEGDKAKILEHWPAVPFYGENCYHHVVSNPGWWRGDGFTSLREAFTAVLDDAKELHANTLDLRIEEDAEAWVNDHPDLVQDFILNGGYRFEPSQMTLPSSMDASSGTAVTAKWRNQAVGRLPNNLPQYGGKYRLAYALLDRTTGRPVYKTIDTADPGTWLKGTTYTTSVMFAPNAVPKGTYDFAFAIVNRDNCARPEVKPAITTPATSTGWYVLGQTEITSSVTPGPAQPLGECPGSTTRLPQSAMSVAYVDSQETTGEKSVATNVLDGNSSTLWHTQWSGTAAPMPHEIQLDLGTTRNAACIYYTPRQTQTTGRIANYEVYTSINGTNWGASAKKSTFTNTAAEQAACFSPRNARYIKLKATSEVNGGPWTSAAELNVSVAG
jgi:hypothetical protein